MDFELEVFEVYDENEPQASKKHPKHTRKKCKQKGKSKASSSIEIDCTESEITQSKTKVLHSDPRTIHRSLRDSIVNVFSKLVIWRGSSRYRATGKEKLDSPLSSRDYRRGYSVPCDNQRRIHANDRVFNGQFRYASNFIKTSKYSILTFLPLNLFEQFQRLANFYFLCLLVLQLIPAISSLTPVTTALPLIGVLGLTAIKDAYDDIQRHISDSHVNNRKSKVVRNGKLVQEKWSAVQVGDIIRMDNNTFVAADLLLLTSSEPNGLCYIETSELDGETNLKCRQCLVETAEMGQDDALISEFDGEIVCEQPNNLLNKFEGVLIWKGKTYSLDNDKIILRGCVLRNTAWCYGVVIFAGKDTKLMQNSGKSKFKRTSIDRLLNFLIIGIVFFLLSMCLFCMVACGIWESLVGRYFQTFLPWDTLVPSEPLGGATIIALLVFFSYAIVLNTVVPISLYVSVEVIRFVQSFLINWDEQMYYKKYNAYAKARTTTLNEELGQIEYIFSDKTGTLTQNIMTFNKCSIGGACYGDIIDPHSGDVIEITDDTEPVDFSFNANYEPEFRFYDQQLLEAVRRRDKDCFQFFRLLALCHTVMSEQSDGKLEYQAQSPDEAALVSAARNFGFVFKERTPNSITIEVMGTKEVYELLCILDFNNIRKRMSVILRKDGKLTLYCKGADNVIYERLKQGQEEIKVRTQDHLNKFAGEGLRTLCLAYCDLEENFFNDWKQRHQEAAIALEGRDEKLDSIYEEIERDLLLIGATAIEDKLQDGVPGTISNLIMAGIKIWVLTGDKQETAINIGYSCQLLTDELVDVFIVDASSYDEVKQQLLKFRDNIKIVNTYKPVPPATLETEIRDGSTFRSSNENGVNQGTNGTNRGNSNVSSVQNVGSGPPAVSVVTFSTELEYLGGIEESHVEETSAGFAIVVNGHSLVHCLHPQLERLFLDVVMQCKSVICCRVTPLQKALVVELVKKSKHAVTLAIGDGANDVSMIKAAHIGVGISGEEGMQAVLASDYSIAQFRFLERLLLVHGRWSYYRMCAFLRYFFNKNFAFTLCHFWYAFFCGFSAQTVFDPMYISIYNLFYTSLPVLALGIFDQDVNDKNSIAYPQLYRPGHLNLFFNKKEFFRSALQGCFVSIALFFIAFGTYYDAVAPNGQGLSDYMLFCSITAAILVIVNTAQIAMDTQYWTVFNHVMIWGSLAFYFIADNFYNYVCSGPYVGSLTKAMAGANFWFTTVLVVIICVLPVLAYRFYFVDVFPTLSDRVRLKQRLAQVRSRQSQDVLRTPSARRARRSIRSGYAFAHQEGFGRLITSGKIMRKLPNTEFHIPNLMNKLNISNSIKENRNQGNTSQNGSGSSTSGGRAPIQDLDTINL
ncbi:probable phospholipid-transporting ATPase IM isoform X2 [Anthonomus grandis grandis]|uniref:probable phospholipid-transporting ATPase IM isoform X2 n=1 Tax=Anthonomus grandis grandis TaxID=2921223 RepID=UPI002165A107|nr:probable phospholipid-transporting ATPase IM isoform X2 [Anthonomus grandis grandis]